MSESDRNQKIVLERCAGAKQVALAEKYGISKERIKQICDEAEYCEQFPELTKTMTAREIWAATFLWKRGFSVSKCST